MLLLSDLVIREIPEGGSLVAQEVLSLFYVDDAVLLERVVRDQDPQFADNVWSKLSLGGWREIESFTSTGFVAATLDIMVAYMRPGPRGFPSVINVIEIDFARDDDVLELVAWRNTGWREKVSSHDRVQVTTCRDIIRVLGSVHKFRKMGIDDKISRSYTAQVQQFNSRELSYSEKIAESDHLVSKGNIIGQEKGDVGELLIASIAGRDLDAFKRALANGEDPNIAFPDGNEPLVFALAADGQLAWVEALIASGRCDLTRVGVSGVFASHAPGVTARFFAASGPDEMVRKFTRIAVLLREEESRQLAAGLSPCV